MSNNFENTAPLYQSSGEKAVFEGNVDEGSLMAGQVAGMIHEIKPVKQILEEMMSELQETYSNLEI